MRLYLAGPMQGYPNHNRDTFNKHALRLRGLGFDVVNPAELDATHAEPSDYVDYYKRDIPYLLSCEAVAVLPGWRKSKGATIETYLARMLRMTVMDALTLDVILPSQLPNAVHPEK